MGSDWPKDGPKTVAEKSRTHWILSQLRAKGRVIPYDENNEEHRGRRARMFQVAEAVKIRLSEQKTDKVSVPVQVDFLVDDHGQRVQFREKINREQYAALIQDELQRTIQCCRSAIEGAGIRTEDLDAILLVGGSTHGKWVVDVVAKEFNQASEPYFPDEIVAAGAALYMAMLPYPIYAHSFVLSMDVPSIASSAVVEVAGMLRHGLGDRLSEQERQELSIQLYVSNGTCWGATTPNTDGKFAFREVTLPNDGENAFKLAVVTSKGQPLLAHRFAVVRTSPEPSLTISIPLIAVEWPRLFGSIMFGGMFRCGRRVLGTGTRSVVVNGEQVTVDSNPRAIRPVAIKIQGPLQDERAVEAFYHGPLVLQRLWTEADPRIRSRLAALLALGTVQADEQIYGWTASELIRGQTLNQFGRVPVAQTMEILLQICEVVGSAHALQPALVHGDLHPGNVILQPNGIVRLIDFGCTSYHRWHSFISLGPSYVAPELRSDANSLNHATYEAALHPTMDVYSLGAILYRLVTGSQWRCVHELGFGEISDLEILLGQKPTAALGALLQACLSLNPKDRFNNANEMHASLANVIRCAGVAFKTTIPR